MGVARKRLCHRHGAAGGLGSAYGFFEPFNQPFNFTSACRLKYK